jgi:predicted amino acid racemase
VNRTPRLEIRLDHIEHNAATLVGRLGTQGMSVTGVTKATLGSPDVARAMLRAGVTGIGESRIENIERLRAAGIDAPMTLIRSPAPSQAARVVASADVSLNSEPKVIEALAAAAVARGTTHGVVLMVELGDLREGILPADLPDAVLRTSRLPGVALRGIGTNLACQSGVSPDGGNMAFLSDLAGTIEEQCGVALTLVSGGNSANLPWAFDSHPTGRINDLRLGESILLGCEPLRRTPIEGLHTDAFALIGEVIESKRKPTRAWGTIEQAAFGTATTSPDTGITRRVLVALGRQDVDPDGLRPPAGMTILGASSDHLVLDAGDAPCRVGTELSFGLDYSALLRAMTSPFVARCT